MDNGNYPNLQSSASPISHVSSTSFSHNNCAHLQMFQQQQQEFHGSMHSHFHSMNKQKQQLHLFWQQQMQEMRQVAEFRHHQLPLARIKKIMKSDEEVKMISAEATVLFSKACELFILELTLRSWLHTEENKRRTLQKDDIAGAIRRGDILDFLVDIVPKNDIKEDEHAAQWQQASHGEIMPYAGLDFPIMNAQPYRHGFPTDLMSTHQALPQQFLSQQNLMPDQQCIYPPQEPPYSP
eukprot:TRINITY_DN129_c0_g1_i1.p1 TRINITY_DN129_c0_g1~~TRINITY_DN129_c0_g1_i1.p1  ORF type:complete len:238 (-),score=51.66 TRINITY_DN129_c0_g1_i1:298-1011(-)